MENKAAKQMALLNEFLEQGQPVTSKFLPKSQIILEQVIGSLDSLANNNQNNSKSLSKAFDAMTELNNRLEKNREKMINQSDETVGKNRVGIKP